MINAEGIVEMLRSGLTIRQVAEIKHCSKSSVARHASLAGHKFNNTSVDWEIGDDLIKEGRKDEDVAKVLECSISSVKARRVNRLGMGRKYLWGEPMFNYKEWLDQKLQKLYQEFKQHIPWEYDRWRQWLKTPYGQMYLEICFTEPDVRKNHCEEYSIGNGRSGRSQAQP
jgi:hypothetical protein